MILSQFLKELDSVHLRHLDVQQNGSVITFSGLAQSLAGVGTLLHLESLAREDAPAGLADYRVVIYDQQSSMSGHDLPPYGSPAEDRQSQQVCHLADHDAGTPRSGFACRSK
jgi:hypothetical protein